MKLSSVAELIVVIAAGLGLGRWTDRAAIEYGPAVEPTAIYRFRGFASGFFAGAAAVGSLSLLVEVGRRRSPRPWGPGRWAWSVVGLSLASQLALSFFVGVMMNWWTGTMEKYFNLILADTNLNICILTFRYSPHVLIAVWATRVASGAHAAQADAREWSGVAFGILLVVTSSASYVLAAAGL
jgi:hypothetical protein